MDFKEELEKLLQSESRNSEELLKLIGSNFVPKTTFNEKNEELKNLKQQSMSAEQLAQEQIKEALNEANRIKSEYENKVKEFTVKTNRMEAEKLFVKEGIAEEDYGRLLDSIVTDDLDRTLNTVKGFTSILSKTKDLVKSKTTEDLLNDTPKPENGESKEVDNKMSAISDSGQEFELGNLNDF